MGQDRTSGAAASAYGHEMTVKVANYLGTMLLSSKSNEAYLYGKHVVIKCAHYRVPQIGVTKKMLGWIDLIIPSLETKRGDYEIYKVTPQWYKSKMAPSRGKSPFASNVLMVSCKDIINGGQHIATMISPTNNETSRTKKDSMKKKISKRNRNLEQGA